MNTDAPEGQVYVCSACGKRSRDRYGEKAIDRGWDVSCALSAVLVQETDALRRDAAYVETLRAKAIRGRLRP